VRAEPQEPRPPVAWTPKIPNVCAVCCGVALREVQSSVEPYMLPIFDVTYIGSSSSARTRFGALFSNMYII
jgi:hypothetical protein